MFKPEQKMPSTADVSLESTRLTNRLFSKYCLSNATFQNNVFEGKVVEQKQDATAKLKSHQENFDSRTKLRLNKTQQ
jgi:hypothetical protein